MQGLVWIFLLVRGISAIRAHDRRAHVRFMLAMYAVATGAVWFRVMTGTAIALHLPFTQVYAAAAWLGWMIPLTMVSYLPAFQTDRWQRPPLPSPGQA